MSLTDHLIDAFKDFAVSISQPVINNDSFVITDVVLDNARLHRYFQLPKTISFGQFLLPSVTVKIPENPSASNPFIIDIPLIKFDLLLKSHDIAQQPQSKFVSLLDMIKLNIKSVCCTLQIASTSFILELNDITTKIGVNGLDMDIPKASKKTTIFENVELHMKTVFHRDENQHIDYVNTNFNTDSLVFECKEKTYSTFVSVLQEVISAVFDSDSIEDMISFSTFVVEIKKLNIVLHDLLGGSVTITLDDLLFTLHHPRFSEKYNMYEGLVSFEMGNVSIKFSIEEIQRDVVWTIEKGKTVDLKMYRKLIKAGVEPKGNEGVSVEANCKGLGFTLDFEMLSMFINLLKITLNQKTTGISVNQEKINEIIKQTEKHKESLQSKYESLLKFLQLKSIMDLLGKIYFSFNLQNCQFSLKFNTGAVFVATLNKLFLNNYGHKKTLNTLQICNEKLKKNFEKTEVAHPLELDIHIEIDGFEGYRTFNEVKELVFIADMFNVDFKFVFDKEATKGIPSIIYCEGRSDNLEMSISHEMFLELYNYLQSIIKSFQEQEKEHFYDLGKQIGSTVAESANKIADKSIEFIKSDLKKIKFPTVALYFSFGKGRAALPLASIIYRNAEHDTKMLTEAIRSELEFVFVSDDKSRSLGIVVDEISTTSVEPILEPLDSISKKPTNKGFLYEHLPQTTPSFILTMSHTTSKIKSTKNITMDVQLYGVQVKLKNLGVFGKNITKQITSKLEKKENTEDKTEDDDSKSDIQKPKEVNEKDVDIQLKALDFFKEQYHGLEMNVQMSECDVVAEDELHTISVTTSNKYVKSGEEICEDLTEKIKKETEEQERLELEVAQLKVHDLESMKQPVQQPKTKSRFPFWKK
ncbi:Chorein N-terminal domain-containing protein [Entamoeba marina]